MISNSFSRNLSRGGRGKFLQSVRTKSTKPFLQMNNDKQKLEKLAKLRGRCYLPGADKATFPEYLNGPHSTFPLVLEANTTNSMEKWGTFCREEIDNRLLEYGAILFRGLGLSSAEDFQKLVRLIGYPEHSYDGGSGQREAVAKQVYSASDEPPEFSIELHNEMSYMPVFNKKFFLCCLKPPVSGGLAVICKNSDLLKQLDKEFLEKIDKKKIRYIRNHPDVSSSSYLSWQKAFDTESKEIAEKKMKHFGFEWEWSTSNNLKFWYIVDAFKNHHVTGERIWFNQAHAMHSSYFKAHPAFRDADVTGKEYPQHCVYGDGEEIEERFIQNIREVSWSCAVGIPLKKGDVLVLDNMLVQHGRLGFEGERRVVVALSD